MSVISWLGVSNIFVAFTDSRHLFEAGVRRGADGYKLGRDRPRRLRHRLRLRPLRLRQLGRVRAGQLLVDYPRAKETRDAARTRWNASS